jgi:hypothetical protein
MPDWVWLPLAVFGNLCVCVNFFQVNRRIWRMYSLENEWNRVYRWFMRKCGVDRGMALYMVLLFIIPQSLLICFFPELLTVFYMLLSVVAPLVLINDYTVFRALRKDICMFKVL